MRLGPERTMVVLAAAAGGLAGVAAALGLWWLAAVFAGALIAAVLWSRGAGSPLLAAVLAAYAVLGDRLLLVAGSGGSGRLPLGLVLGVGLAVVLLVASPPARHALTALVMRGTPMVLFLALGAMLPVVGVVFGYPPRTLLASAVPVMALGFVLLGDRFSAESEAGGLKRLGAVMLWVTAPSALAAVAQTLHYGGIDLPGVQALIDWDVRTAAIYGHEVISGRATGLYDNPNALGVAGAIGLMWGLFAEPPRVRRLVILGSSMLMLVLAQARGVTTGVLTALAVVLFMSLVPSAEERAAGRSRAAWMPALLVGAGGAAVVALALPEVWAKALERFVSAFEVMSQGVAASPDLSARLDAWRGAGTLAATYVFGTFGPPELLLGVAADNDYVKLGLQGGMLYVAFYVSMFVWVFMRAKATAVPMLYRSLAVVFLVSSLSQSNSSFTPFLGLFYALVGVGLGSLTARRAQAGSHEEPSAGDAVDGGPA